AQRPMKLRAPRMFDAHNALRPELEALDTMGVAVDWNARSCVVHPTQRFAPVSFAVNPDTVYSDSQPLLAVLAAHADGRSSITDMVWTQRFSYAEGLAKLGFRVDACPPKLTLLGGGPVRPLAWSRVAAHDLRAAAALLLAALSV